MKITTKKSPPATPIKRNRSKTKAVTERDISIELPDINVNSFDEAVHDFIKTIEAEPGLEDKYKLVCADLESTFCELLPGVKARLFGSTVTGLAFKESDLDIFMECLDGQPPKNFVARKGYLLYKNVHFKNVVKIAHARVPIIKCVHQETNLSCDVTFMSKLGVMNTKLIKFLLSLDERIRPMFMMIKCWGRLHELTSVGRFSNYALVILGVYYLQQMEDPILPSVQYLQDLVFVKDFCGSWECSFCDDRNTVPLSSNKLTLKNLISGFFKFYSQFDYEKYLICPLLGKSIDKCYFTIREDDNAALTDISDDVYRFMEIIRNSPEDTKFIINSPLCVQDPFDLSFNITKSVSLKLCKKFFSLCKYVVDYIFNEDLDYTVHDIFKLLFSESCINNSKLSTSNDKFQKNISIRSVNLPNTTLEYQLTDEYKQKWFISMKKAILLVFETVYKFTIDKDANVSKLKNDFINVKELMEEAFKDLCFKCEGDSAIYQSRKKAEKQLFLSKRKCLEREIKVSDFIVKHAQNLTAFECYVKLTCYPTVDPPQLSILMTDTSKKKYNSFKAFSAWIHAYIEEHCNLALTHTIDDETYFNDCSRRNSTKMDCTSPPVDASNFASSSSMNVDETRLRLAVVQSCSQNVTSENLYKSNKAKKKKKRKYPYLRNITKPEEYKVRVNPATLLLEAIERPLIVEEWN
ncbi:uncharacterized protein LOC142331134 isoform X4 [Lycorma delicatula]